MSFQARGCFAAPTSPLLPRKPAVVLEQVQRQRQRHRLRQDRQVDARDAAAERQPAEHQRQQAGHQDNHQKLQQQDCRQRPRVSGNSELPTTPKIWLPMASVTSCGCGRNDLARAGWTARCLRCAHTSATCRWHSRRCRKMRNVQGSGCRNSPRPRPSRWRSGTGTASCQAS